MTITNKNCHRDICLILCRGLELALKKSWGEGGEWGRSVEISFNSKEMDLNHLRNQAYSLSLIHI